MKLERHVFGSRTGYTTLARSPGISDQEARALETFAFGQTNDPGYLASLANSPAHISRPLGSSRRAITRVLPGKPDDQERSTLLLVSAIIDNASWLGVLNGNVLPLLATSSLWTWDETADLSPVNVPLQSPQPPALTPATVEAALAVLAELERAAASGGRIILKEQEAGADVVRAVEMLIPDGAKPAFSCAARSLSAKLDVQLNCVAREVGVGRTLPSAKVYTPRVGQ